MGKLKSSSEDPNESISKVLSGIWQVVWFVIKWLFIISFTIVAFILALAGLRLPELDFGHRPNAGIDPKKFRNRKEFPNLKLKDILELDKVDKQLRELERQGKLKPEQEKVVRKLRKFDRSKYDSRLKNLFNDDEMEELLELLLSIFKLLGIEVF